MRYLYGSLVFVLLSACATPAPPALFEGSIYYRMQVRIAADLDPASDTTGLEQFRRDMQEMVATDRQVFHFAPQNFKIEHTQTISEELFDFDSGNVLLLEERDKYYRKKSFAEERDSLLAYRHLSQHIDVLGRRCSGLELTILKRGGDDTTRLQIYYDAQLAVDPRQFSEVRRDAWNVIFRETRAVPLMLVVDSRSNRGLTATFEAERIEAGRLADSVFSPQPGVPIGPKR